MFAGAKIFPLAVASLPLVEGCHTYDNHYVGIISAVLIHLVAGDHWINFDNSFFFFLHYNLDFIDENEATEGLHTFPKVHTS